MKCSRDTCNNEARYIDAWGDRLCGVHDALTRTVSVRMSDVPEIIAYLIAGDSNHQEIVTELAKRGLISRKKRT